MMGYAMNTNDTKTLTISQFQAIEARAHELRAQAFAAMVRRLFGALFSAPRKVVSCPSCARPLHG
ncbi:RSP_7527 family protein [Leisingera sp. ANG-DT]|uniref:RSP_7527 family protein n=1 Tax=Leisingera sp. ANG-DT TaxID=1577897 RepID=UPI00057CAA7F|nr:hypothetical protein [Leisingera sp. ANG-DT]KIC19010.1 hypothetical protein RA21_00260 [Leisingera sp. ANG-DT]